MYAAAQAERPQHFQNEIAQFSTDRSRGNIQQGKSMKNVLARSFNTPLGMEVSISFRFVEFGLGTFRFVFVVFCFELRVSSPWRDVRGGSSRETAAISK